jgi:hypothetical protein
MIAKCGNVTKLRNKNTAAKTRILEAYQKYTQLVDGILARNWFLVLKERTGMEVRGAWKVQVPRLCDW